MAERSTDLTLAFTLEALQALADPRAAIEDAREWSQYVGAVSAGPNAALSYARERRVRLDFFSGTRPPAETLYAVQSNYETERHVLVGLPDQRALAADRGWTFQPIAEAAERAGWALDADVESADDGPAGSIGRLVDRLRSVVGV